MSPSFHNLLKSVLCLVLLGILSGCQALVELELIPEPYPDPLQTGKNHYKPIILTSTKDMIQIKYLSVGPNAQHEKVLQLIFDHCDGAYIETSREELRGYTTVEAECTHDTVS
jgi:hypothetical protein